MPETVLVRYDGVIVGDFLADLLVDRKVMIELKANQALVVANEARLVNYSTATGLEGGLLINFGAQRLDCELARTHGEWSNSYE